MAIKTLNKAEIELLTNEYPQLRYDVGKNAIEGILPFNLKFGPDGVVIIDQYVIEIDLNHVSEFGIPIIKETSNRIVEIAAKKGIPPIDLHLNNMNGSMCIIIPPKAKERYPNGFDLKELLRHIQEHLYWISYFEKYNKAPWKTYGHGDLGYLQLYLEDKIKYTSDFKEHFNCKSRPEFRRKIKELKKIHNL